MFIAKFFIALSVVLWAALFGALLFGYIHFVDPRLAPLLMALASMLEVCAILCIYMLAIPDYTQRRK